MRVKSFLFIYNICIVILMCMYYGLAENVTTNVNTTQLFSNDSEVLDMLNTSATAENADGADKSIKDIDESPDAGPIDENMTTPESLMNITAKPQIKEEPDAPNGPSIGVGESALILAITVIILAGVAYGGLISWRRYLQIRYGNSDMLITDDVYDITDLRHFEI